MPQTNLQKKLLASQKYRNNGVVQIGRTQIYDTIKFSVLDKMEQCQFVHLTRYGCQVICASGLCNVAMNQSRSKGLISLEQSEVHCLCPHLQTMMKFLPLEKSVREEQDGAGNEDVYGDDNEIIA